MAKVLHAIGLAGIFFLTVAVGDARGQTQAPPPHAAPAAPAAAITAAEVIAKSSEAASFLGTVAEKFAPSAEIEKIERTLPEITRQVDLDFTDTSVTLGEQPLLTTIQAEQTRWHQRHLQVSSWLTVLIQRAVELRAAYDTLSRSAGIWVQTREAVQAEQAPAAIVQQVLSTLGAIQTAQAQLKSQEDAVLGLQGSLAAELSRCDEVLAQVSRAQKSAVAGMLSRENPPIWSSELWAKARATLPDRLSSIARGFGTNIRQYLTDPARGLPVHAALLLALTLAAVAARRRKRQWAARGIGVSAVVNVFDRPYSAALMLVLWGASAALSPAPARVKDLLLAVAFVPVMRLMRPMVDPRVLSMIFAGALLYMVDLVRRALGGALLVEQALLVLESVVAIGALGWVLQHDRLRHIPGQVPAVLRSHFGPALLKLLVIALVIGGLAAGLGFTRLARLITPAVLNGGVLALVLFAAARVARKSLAIALRARPLDRLQMVRKHCDLLESWAQRLFFWAAAFIWARRFLEYIGLLDPVVALGNAILETRLERGSISISIEDILAFGITVWAAYLLSAFIRFALQEEVYPRRGVARGMSYAYSRLAHYVILAFGFLVGLGVLGLDLSKVSVLAGAFGVGIGFGLQDVVNNFELRAWTDQFDNWGLVRSELASAVYDAVYAAGLSFPFPQREVRVLGEPAAEKSVAPQPDGGTEPEQKR